MFSGKLERLAKSVTAARKWKTYWCVLTVDGYLQLFECAGDGTIETEDTSYRPSSFLSFGAPEKKKAK